MHLVWTWVDAPLASILTDTGGEQDLGSLRNPDIVQYVMAHAGGLGQWEAV